MSAASRLSSTTSPATASPGARGGPRIPRRRGRNLIRSVQVDGERTALANPVALAFDPAAVELDEVAHDREAAPEPAARAIELLLLLDEWIEDTRQHVALAAAAVVGDRDRDLVAARHRHHLAPTVFF